MGVFLLVIKYMSRLLSKEFLKRMGALTERIRNDVLPFDDVSPAAIAERKARALADDLFFARTYFPHECRDEFADFHPEMQAAQDVKNRIVAIYGSRGCAKTSMAKIKRIKRTVFRLHRFVAIVGETVEQATERCAEIRAEFESNARLICDFGDLRSLAPWEFGYFKTSNGVTYRSFGWRSRFKGRRSEGNRFDDVYVDDYEDSQTRYNLDIVKKKYLRLKGDLLGATNLKDYWFTFVGNYFSTFSVLHDLKNDPEVLTYKFLIDQTGDCVPNWPGRYSRDDLLQLKRTMGSLSYAIEIMQQPRDEDEQVCKDVWFKEWRNADWDAKPHTRVGYLDPSMKNKESGDYKAIVCIRFHRDPYRVLTDRVWIRRVSVDEMVNMIFKIYKEEKLDVLGIEANNVQEYLAPLIAAKAITEGWHPHIRWIDQTANKETRLLGQTSDIENGLVLFQRENSDQAELIEQWKFLFQSGMHDDGPDAHEGVIALARNFTAGVKFHRTPKSGGIASLFKKGAW